MSDFDPIKKAAKELELPTVFIDTLDRGNSTWFRKSTGAGYSPFRNTIFLTEETYDRMTEGKLNKKYGLGGIYNEMFHAYYDQVIEEKLPGSEWISEMMEKEASRRYNGDLVMVEEAMSETIDHVIGNMLDVKLLKNRLGQKPRLKYEHCAHGPDHAGPGEKWANQRALAKTKISQDLYYMTLYVLFCGYQRPPGWDFTRIKRFVDETILIKSQ